MVPLLAALVALTIVSTADLRQPVYWGTFTESDCEPKSRGGCRSIGIWVSDDQTIVKEQIYLDGWVEADGTVRAAYRPTGIISDESNNIVHTALWIGAGPWVCLFAMGVLIFRVLAQASDLGALERGMAVVSAAI